MIAIYDLRVRRILSGAVAERCQDGCLHHLDSGRSALYVVLAALKDEFRVEDVHVNAYTTEVVHSVIRSLGLRPVPYDINPLNLSARWTPPVGGRSFAFVQTGLFGLPAFDADIMRQVKRRDGFFIEDCCNSLGTTIDGVAAGSLGDAAIFSYRVGKPLSVGGGSVRINDPALVGAVSRVLASLKGETLREWRLTRMRIILDYLAFSPFVLKHIARPLREFQKRAPCLRWLVRGGVVDTMSAASWDTIRLLHPSHVALIAQRLREYPLEVALKREVGRRLADALAGLPLHVYAGSDAAGWNGLFFPVLLRQGDPQRLIGHLRRRGFEATRFHAHVPLLSFPELDTDAFPGTMMVCDNLVCLPSTTRMRGREQTLAGAIGQFYRAIK